MFNYIYRPVTAILLVVFFSSYQNIREPKGYAIIVSVPHVNNALIQIKYHYPKDRIYPNLPGSVNDGERIYNILLQEGFEPENIIRLGIDSNDKIKIENILKAFKKISKSVQADDLFVFYYSGHGDQINDQPNGDEKLDSLDEVIVANDGFLFDDEINSIYRTNFSSTRNVMIMDACHAGSLEKLSMQFMRTKNVSPRFHFGSSDCNISTETNVDENINMIYYGASKDENNGYDTGEGGYFTMAFASLYHPKYWHNINPNELACRISMQMQGLSDPGDGLIQYSELGQLSNTFKTDYLFKIK